MFSPAMARANGRCNEQGEQGMTAIRSVFFTFSIGLIGALGCASPQTPPAQTAKPQTQAPLATEKAPEPPTSRNQIASKGLLMMVGAIPSKLGFKETRGVTGRFDVEAALRILQRKGLPLQACHEETLDVTQTTEVETSVRLQISGRGKVSSVIVGKNGANEDLAACLTSVFNKTRFPMPEEGSAVFETTLVFRATP